MTSIHSPSGSWPRGLWWNTPRTKLLSALLYSEKPLLKLCVGFITVVSVLAAILSGFGGSVSLSTALRSLGWACEGGKGLRKHLETIRDPEDLHGNLRLFSNPLINLCVAFVQPATCSPMWRSESRLSANRAQNWIPLKSRLMRCPRRSPSLISCARRMRWTWSDYSSNCKAVSAWRSVSIAQS